jgi:predicted porin
MKKVALSFLLVMGITNAYAQSSVTLYGAIDDELAYTNNAGGSKQLQDGCDLVWSGRGRHKIVP